MLGVREPDIYGRETLEDIRASCDRHVQDLPVALEFHQSNSEAELIDWIQESRDTADAIVINPAAFTHTSVAIQDALVLSENPVVEIHLSNIFQREAFRQHSYVSAVAKGIISGFGAHGYILAIDAALRLVKPAEEA